jgi:hypothetical protein
MLLYKPGSTIGSSMTDLPVQFGVPPKPSINFLVHKTQYTKTKLTHVGVGCMDVMKKLGVPDC